MEIFNNKDKVLNIIGKYSIIIRKIKLEIKYNENITLIFFHNHNFIPTSTTYHSKYFHHNDKHIK